MAGSAGKDIIAVTQTPKEIGKINVIIEWFLPSGAAEGKNIHIHTEENYDGDWNAVMNQMVQWMTKHLYPHQVISFSAYEEEHPNTKTEINVSVFYRDQEHESVVIPADIDTPVFKFEQTHLHGVWAETYKSGVDTIIKHGVIQSKTFLATANHSVDNSKRQLVLYWNRDAEAAMASQARGGCCTIF